jgi:hypothetical protein
MARTDDRKTEVLEEGDIFFLYRPAVEEDEPSGLADVQRFYVVLRPQGGRLRLLVMGRKRLPDVEQHERTWGFVAMVANAADTIEKEMQEADYETKTRGKRRLPAARPAGEGVYAVTLEDGQMHLSYSLELPERPKEVQQEFNIAPEASYALSVKNPEAGQPRAAGLSRTSVIFGTQGVDLPTDWQRGRGALCLRREGDAKEVESAFLERGGSREHGHRQGAAKAHSVAGERGEVG